MKVRLTIIQCADCKRLCFAVGGTRKEPGSYRISPHKCSGNWKTIVSEVVQLEEIVNNGFPDNERN